MGGRQDQMKIRQYGMSKEGLYGMIYIIQKFCILQKMKIQQPFLIDLVELL